MRRALVLTFAALLFAVPAADGATRSCGTVVFTPNSDDGAFGVRATFVSCRTARQVAARSQRTSPVDGPTRYRALGFRCRGRARDTALPTMRWRCTRSGAVVTFTRS